MSLEYLILTRISHKTVTVDVSGTLASGGPASIDGVQAALLSPYASPTSATLWRTVTFANGEVEVPLAGPDAPDDDFLVVPAAGASLWLRVVDNEEIEPVRVMRISVRGAGGPLSATLTPDAYMAGLVRTTDTETHRALDEVYDVTHPALVAAADAAAASASTASQAATNSAISAATAAGQAGSAQTAATSARNALVTATVVGDNLVLADVDGDTTNAGNVRGPKGDAATVSVKSTTTGAAGTSASVANSGSSSAATLDFIIPKGDPGDLTLSDSATAGATFTPTYTSPRTVIRILSANTTANAFAVPASNVSFTCTTVLKQAASGGPYTVTWPAPSATFRWAGDAPAPTMPTAANAELIVNLLWTGSAWRGTVAGVFLP